jgi:hypothetical protein
MFGQWYSMPKARTKVYCATGDLVCDASKYRKMGSRGSLTDVM